MKPSPLNARAKLAKAKMQPAHLNPSSTLHQYHLGWLQCLEGVGRAIDDPSKPTLRQIRHAIAAILEEHYRNAS